MGPIDSPRNLIMMLMCIHYEYLTADVLLTTHHRMDAPGSGRPGKARRAPATTAHRQVHVYVILQPRVSEAGLEEAQAAFLLPYTFATKLSHLHECAIKKHSWFVCMKCFMCRKQ
jgi:hypothetical protein